MHSRQMTTTFCLINVSGRSTYSSVHCRWQSVSCYSRSSVEQSSITRHCCPPLSSSSAVRVLNHISSHFLIPLSDSSLICTVPVQWLVILDTIIAITFGIYKSLFCITCWVASSHLLKSKLSVFKFQKNKLEMPSAIGVEMYILTLSSLYIVFLKLHVINVFPLFVYIQRWFGIFLIW